MVMPDAVTIDTGMSLADAEVFEARLREALPAALRLARTAGCTDDEAADAAQDAAIAAWRHRAQLRGEFRPWFLAIVLRQARRQRRWRTVPLGWLPRDGAPPGDGSVDPQLASALRGLTARQRTALWLRYGLDMSTADTATVLGTTDTATKQLLLRAREALRRRLGEMR